MKKREKKTTKVIANYLRTLAIKIVLKECNFNMRMVKNHIFRECKLPKGFNWFYIKKLFNDVLEKQYIENNETTYKIVESFLYKNFGGKE